MSRYFRNAILLTLGIKVIFYVFGNIIRPDPIANGEFFKIFMENDSYWYKIIFDSGYPKSIPGTFEQSSFAFFPLYPLLLKSLGFIFGSFANSAFVLSLILGFLWIKGIFKYIASTGKTEKDAFWLVVLLQCIPFQYFYHMFYSELLFATILLWLMYYVNKKSFLGVLVFSALLTATRPTGLLFAFTLFLMVMFNIPWRTWLNRSSISRLLPFIGAPLGIASYALYCCLRVGNAFVFRDNMKAWQRDYGWPWESFSTDIVELQYLGIYVVILFLIGLYAAFINKGKYALIILPNIIFPLCTGTVISYPRYFSINHPIFENLQSKLSFLRNPWVLSGLFILNLGTFAYWVLVHNVLSY